ncbi:hypothetical protein ACWGID_33650 [Kribbella sp. NPDC054772]
MIDLSQTRACHDVRFDPARTGAEIVAAAKVITERSGDVHHEDMYYRNGYLVEAGRASEHLERGLVIAQNLDLAYLDPTAKYSSVTLAHHDLPDAGAVIRPQNATLENTVGSLKEFGADLQRELDAVPAQAAHRERALAEHRSPRGADGSVKPIQLDVTDTRQAIKFDRPITGRELMASVKACSVPDRLNHSQYYEAAGPDGSGFVVGQSSGHPDHTLVVVPTSGEGYIDPERTYAGVLVANHHLVVPGQHRLAVPASVDGQSRAVGEFADRLDRSVRTQIMASRALDRGSNLARGSDTGRPGAGDGSITQTYDYAQRPSGTRLGDNGRS